MKELLLSFLPLARPLSYLDRRYSPCNVNLKPCNHSPIGAASVLTESVLCCQAQRLHPQRLPREPISSIGEAHKLHICPRWQLHIYKSIHPHPPPHPQIIGTSVLQVFFGVSLPCCQIPQSLSVDSFLLSNVASHVCFSFPRRFGDDSFMPFWKRIWHLITHCGSSFKMGQWVMTLS